MRWVLFVIRSAALTTFVLSAGVFQAAKAQSVDSITVQRESVLGKAARHNWYVRASQSGGLVSGRVRSLEGDTAVIGAQRIAQVDIAHLERRTNVGGGWKAGALIGGGSFAAIGYGLAGMCESNCGGTQLGLSVAGAMIGAVVGGVVGQALVPAKHEWHTIWP